MSLTPVMHPLRIAFLWHFHQPDYRMRSGSSTGLKDASSDFAETSFILPWVRLHATKDYAWLPSLIGEYPAVRQTINVVPSLMDQLAAYGHGTTDYLQQESQRLSNGELPSDASLFAKALTVINASRMITHPRHRALHEQASTDSCSQWTLQEWTDLSVWYHLAWCSPQLRRGDDVIKSLLQKGENFTGSDLFALQKAMVTACQDIAPTLKRLAEQGSIGLSVTPYHHPILPLICDTRSALEALPSSELPADVFAHSDDADAQVSRALTSFNNTFGFDAVGMWPAEGSISNEALRLFAKNNVRWVASDEGVLANSLGNDCTPTSKYHAWSVSTNEHAIPVLFRDRGLSDAIGFVYSSWADDKAADDFVRTLEERRRLIVANEGEDALLDAVVTVILDGENCWEFYDGNGEPFLRELFTRLSDTTRYACIDMLEASRTSRSLAGVVAGSWIGSSFDVWIGSPLKNLAWTLLQQARSAMDRANVDDSVWDEMYSAESSDWFWWYDDRHAAPNKRDFDTLFRMRLATIFKACGLQPSVNLDVPLYDQLDLSHSHGKDTRHISYGSVAMHSGNQLVHSVGVETNDAWSRVSIRLERKPEKSERVAISMRSPGQQERRITVSHDTHTWSSIEPDETMQWQDELTIVLYVKTQSVWSVDIEEVNAGGQSHTAVIHFNTP